jgi:hypothetical protein
VSLLRCYMTNAGLIGLFLLMGIAVIHFYEVPPTFNRVYEGIAAALTVICIVAFVVGLLLGH